MSAADDPHKTRWDELLCGPSTVGEITIIFSFNHSFITWVIWCSLARQRPISFPLLIPVSEAKLIKCGWRDGVVLQRKWPTSIFSLELVAGCGRHWITWVVHGLGCIFVVSIEIEWRPDRSAHRSERTAGRKCRGGNGAKQIIASHSFILISIVLALHSHSTHSRPHHCWGSDAFASFKKKT